MAKRLNNGCIIVFEGIDGVGKTTQLELAKAGLEADGWPVYTTRNLGGTPIGEELRKAIISPVERPPTTDLYASVAIQEALLKELEEQRQAGKLILMDRSPLSLAAYQIYGSGVSEELGWPYVEKGLKALSPEIILFYEADVQGALDRLTKAKSDYFESKPIDYFERVLEGYKTASARFDNVANIDANRSIEAIHADTMKAINETLARHA